jgi:hypothetical protein
MKRASQPNPIAPKRMCFESIANAQRLNHQSDMKLVFPDGRVIYLHTMVAQELFPNLSCEWLKQDAAHPWCRSLEVTSLDACVVQAVVDFAYTDELHKMSVAEAIAVLHAAHYFGAEHMVHRLCAWFVANMTKHDSVLVYENAAKLSEHWPNVAALRDSAMRLIGKNAHELNDAQFAQLVPELRYVITEEVVCDLALAYAERTGDFALLRNVNFGRLPALYRARQVYLITAEPALDLALSTHIIRTLNDPDSMRRRYCLSGTVVTVSERGWATAFCLATGVTYTLPSIFGTASDPDRSPAEPVVIDDDDEDETIDCDSGLAVAVVENKVLVSFVVRSGKRASYALECSELKWRFMGLTNHALHFSACAVLDHEVYLLGGSDQRPAVRPSPFDFVNSPKLVGSRFCEKRTPEGTWVDVWRLPHLAAMGAACVVDGKLIFLGGLNADGAIDEVVQFARDGTVRSIGTMRNDRFDFAAAAVGTKVFCVGGSGADRGSFEVFDTATGLPQRLADLPGGNRHYHTAFVHDGFVYAASAKNLERYSIETDTWENVTRSFPLGVASAFVP